MEPEERQVVDKFHLSSIENLDDIEDMRFKNPAGGVVCMRGREIDGIVRGILKC